MNKPAITVIIPLRNTESHHRDLGRLENCLLSLTKQSIPANRIDIIVSDLDSDPQFQGQHQEICKRLGARYVYTQTGDSWNISRARNVGIKNARADFIMTTDVDCVFAPDFIEIVLRHMAKDKMVHCRISDLPQDHDGQLDNFLWMNKVSILRPAFAYGGCQVFSREWAFKVRGFDEAYKVWGADDTDFYLRGVQDGLKSVWIERETSFFHQWHQSENNPVNRPQINENRIRLKLVEMGKFPIVRNDSGWGSKEIVKPSPKRLKGNLVDVAVLITTFMRDRALFACVKSIRQFYPDIAIFVGDNGKVNAKRKEFCKAQRCTYAKAPFDYGVGATRNKVLERMPGKFRHIVVCEDDILFSDETVLENWLAVLDAENDIGIVGGLLKKADARILTAQNYEAQMRTEGTALHIERIERFDWRTKEGVRYAPCDIVINVFAMKREVWDSQKWDANIKTWPEHEDFFFSVKKNTPWKVAYTDSVSIIHRPTPYPAQYAAFRTRMGGAGYFAKKWGLEYVWNSWHREWGLPNPMKIGLPVPEKSRPMPEKQAEIAIGIKTFLREKSLFETLDAIEKYFPYPYRLYIADDGGTTDEKDYRYGKLQAKGHEIIRLPFNCGISVGRNEIIKRITEDYLLMMDDDIVLQDSESVKHMKSVLDSSDDIGICSGILTARNGEYIGNENYQKGLRFELDRGLLFRYPAHREIHKADGSMYVFADQVVNFFLAKRAVFNDAKWDNRIKVEWEHIDFFLTLQKTRWKAVACLDAKAVHLNPINDPTYNYYRRSVTNQYFFQKHDIHNVINRFA